MPKVLLFITSKIIWTFIFFGTDSNENRAHVHVGKRDTKKMCKIWLEPEVEIASKGTLTEGQANEVASIAAKYRKELLNQWKTFKKGDKVSIIKVKE